MKTIRIILSPLIYLTVMGGMIIIPIGPLCLLMGIMVIFGHILLGRRVDREDIQITLALFLFPYYETKKFVNADPTFLSQ